MKYKVNNGFMWDHVCEAVIKDSADGKLYRYWDEEDEKWLACYDVRMSTGLFDKNGREIFENDLLKMPYKLTVEIIWHEGSFGYFRDVKTSFFTDETEPVFTILRNNDLSEVLVIGNTYETEIMEEYK